MIVAESENTIVIGLKNSKMTEEEFKVVEEAVSKLDNFIKSLKPRNGFIAITAPESIIDYIDDKEETTTSLGREYGMVDYRGKIKGVNVSIVLDTKHIISHITMMAIEDKQASFSIGVTEK